MNYFFKWINRHRKSILITFISFAVAGLLTSYYMPVSLFPQISFPRLVINIDSGERPAEQMALEVTRVLEEAVRVTPGVVNIRSTTSRGSAEISVNFDWGSNMLSSMLQTESEINRILPELPQGTTFEVRRMDPTVFPVLGYSMNSKSHTLAQIRDIALYRIRPSLTTIKGVSKVEVLGGNTVEYKVIINPKELVTYKLKLDDIAQKLSSSNVLEALGRLEENKKLYLILSNNQMKTIKDISDTIISIDKYGVITLSDIATIKKSVVPRCTRITADNKYSVLFQIYQQPAANTVKIASEVKAEIKKMREEKIIPNGINIRNWYDQGELIIASDNNVRDAILIGIGLAAVILVLFLRHLKTILVAVITIPVILGCSLLIFFLLNYSFNIMTLGGLASGIGLIIDDVMVMIEHIVRRLGEETKNKTYKIIIFTAAEEFSRPLFGSSASTIIIFLPLAFLGGVTGAFFKVLSITIVCSLIISFLISWICIPLFSLYIFRNKDMVQEKKGITTKFFHYFYEKIMNLFFLRPLYLFLIIILLIITGFLGYRHLGSGFLPDMDEGGFILDYRTKPGTSLTETDKQLKKVEEIIRNIPEVSTYSRRTGVALGGFLTEANEGDFFIRLKPFPRQPLDAVMEKIREKIEKQTPGLEIEMAKLMTDLIGDLTAVPEPIEIKLFSDNGTTLNLLAPKIADAISNIKGIVDVSDGIIPAGDALNIKIDQIQAGIQGLTAEQVTMQLQGYLSGVVSSRIQEDTKMAGIRVWIPMDSINSIKEIRQLPIESPDGSFIPLYTIAKITIENGQNQITRENLKRMVAVTARINGRDMGTTMKDVIKALNKPGLIPDGVYFSMGGMYQQQQIAFYGLLIVFFSAVILVFILLLYLYERFSAVIPIMLTTLCVSISVFIGMWLTNTDLNIISIMGITMVVGIATEVGIFYYSEYLEIPSYIPLNHRLICAGKNRMRPIAMTTFAAILALMPIASGIGQSAAMLQPLAIAIISGLFFQLPFVLVLLPVLIRLFVRGEKDNAEKITH